ncbi:MAG: protein translocase subunit SecF [Gammaproteobacteria bacterium]|nr:protein translocase subunit SecF [Gammaproteobacteria bacterium]
MADSPVSNPPIIKFMAWRRPALLASAVLTALSIVAIVFKGLVLGLDFSGGTQIELHFPKAVETEVVRARLSAAGFVSPVAAHFGSESDLLIRLREGGDDLATRVIAAIGPDAGGTPELRRMEFVGPQVGAELRDQGGIAVLVALLGILIYVAVRFQYKFALGAALAVAHDTIITVGFFALFGYEFDLTVLAAVLTVIGYSINDTIVVFDRVRENFRLVRKGSPEEVMNLSMTQTLERTLLTSGATLLVVLALFFVGGEVLHNFAIALMVGIGFGTYSSIYVASVLALELGVRREDLLLPVKDSQEFDGLP